jgi:anti-sigma B factor antagonist
MANLEPHNPRFISAQSTDSDGSPLLKLRGELDMLSAVQLREIIEGLVDQRCDRLVLDLDELDFMDSSGIAVLVYSVNSIGTVELRNASPIIRRIIEVTGLSNVLRAEST